MEQGKRVDVEQKDRSIINYMLSDRLCSSTAAGYKGKGLGEWKRFLQEEKGWSEEQLGSTTCFCLLRKEDTDQHRVDMLILYVYFLRQRGVKDVALYCKALGYDFISKGYSGMADLVQSPLVFGGSSSWGMKPSYK